MIDDDGCRQFGTRDSAGLGLAGPVDVAHGRASAPRLVGLCRDAVNVPPPRSGVEALVLHQSSHADDQPHNQSPEYQVENIFHVTRYSNTAS